MIQLFLTGLAGVALGVVLMRLLQRPSPLTLSDGSPESDAPLVGGSPSTTLPLRRSRLVFGAAAILVLAGAAVLAYKSAHPPEAVGQVAAPGSTTAPALDDVDTMITRLEARLKSNPSDGEGFRTLGWSYLNTGKPDQAVTAYAQAVKLLPGRADAHAGYGEALVAVAKDVVTPDAKAQFDEAIKIDPKEPRARFFEAEFKAQNRQEGQALDDWIELSNSQSPDLPWQTDLHDRINKLAAKLGVDVSKRLKPAAAATSSGPDAAAIKAADALPATQRDAMVNSMVEGLASRLQANPDDVDGWIKLIRSRMVLKQDARAKDDLAMARKAFAGTPDKLAKLNTAVRDLGL